MTDDSIAAILDDATMSPGAYCGKWGLQPGGDELADYMQDMCVHLVRRTQEATRNNILGFVCDGSKYKIGDKVIRRDNGRIGEVIGAALGNDGKHCLVLSMDDGHWKTYLCPLDEARKLTVPTTAQVRKLIMDAIQSAANGDSYNADAADGKVNHIMDAAHACFCGEPFPIGGAK